MYVLVKILTSVKLTTAAVLSCATTLKARSAADVMPAINSNMIEELASVSCSIPMLYTSVLPVWPAPAKSAINKREKSTGSFIPM